MRAGRPAVKKLRSKVRAMPKRSLPPEPPRKHPGETPEEREARHAYYREKRRRNKRARARKDLSRKAVLATPVVLLALVVGVFVFRPVGDESVRSGVDVAPGIERDDQPQSALFIGDSYTRGAGASDVRNAWPEVASDALGWVPQIVAAGGTGYVTSLTGDPAERGCGADRCPNFLTQVKEAADRYAPDVVVLAGGRNDLGKSGVGETAGVVIATALSRFPQAEIIVVLPVWDDDVPPEAYGDLRSAVTAAAKSAGVTTLDIGEPLAGKPGLLASDGVHPNDAGHAALAEAFVESYRTAARNNQVG